MPIGILRPNHALSTRPAALSSLPAAPSAVLKLTFRCFDGSLHNLEAETSLTVAALKVAVQRVTGIHQVSQRLVFAGSALTDSDILADTPLVSGCTVFVLTNKSFPASLGPFQVVTVPFKQGDFELPPLGSDFEDQGTMWLMAQRPLARQGVRSRGAEFPLVGQFSPPHPVTLTAEEKEGIGIPAGAARFVWSYPVAAWNAIEGGSDAARSFLSVGGFVYLSADNRVLHATTPLPSEMDVGGLQFLPPKKFDAGWTAALHQQGRFQRITIKTLNEIGAHHFCWLRPGEVVREASGQPCASQPDVPHGGFAYLFHNSVFSSDSEEQLLDRYFACASGDDYVAMTQEEQQEAASAGASTFGLVSDLQALQDLQDRAASQPATSSEVQTEMQTEIHRLEQALHQATKCIACTENDKDTILSCGHVCMCRDCAGRVSRCPLCRAPITERRRAFQG